MMNLNNETEFKKYLVENLIKLPGAINDLSLEIMNHNVKIEELSNKIKILEINQLTDISNTKDSNGKNVFTNDVLRQNELNKFKDTDKEYLDLHKSLKEIELNTKILNLKLKNLNDTQSNLKSLAYMFSSN